MMISIDARTPQTVAYSFAKDQAKGWVCDLLYPIPDTYVYRYTERQV